MLANLGSTDPSPPGNLPDGQRRGSPMLANLGSTDPSPPGNLPDGHRRGSPMLANLGSTDPGMSVRQRAIRATAEQSERP